MRSPPASLHQRRTRMLHQRWPTRVHHSGLQVHCRCCMPACQKSQKARKRCTETGVVWLGRFVALQWGGRSAGQSGASCQFCNMHMQFSARCEVMQSSSRKSAAPALCGCIPNHLPRVPFDPVGLLTLRGIMHWLNADGARDGRVVV